MSLDDYKIAQILDGARANYVTVVEWDDRGKQNTYRVDSDRLAAFVADDRSSPDETRWTSLDRTLARVTHHSHEVRLPDGQVVYFRDLSGRVHRGSDAQRAAREQETRLLKELGSLAVRRAEALAVKQRLAGRAESLAGSTEWKSAGDEFRRLMSEWKAAGSAGREDDDALWKRFSAARDRFSEARKRYFDEVDRKRAAAKGVKERLVARAESLSRSTEWKSAGDEFRRLMSEWKAAGSAGRDQDDALWKRFSAARDRFSEARKRYFDEADRKRSAAKAVKERIVKKAESLAGSTEWKSTGDEFRRLMSEWKAAGSAGREQDDVLWKRFSAARDRFSAARKRHFDEADRKRSAAKAAKERIVARAQAAAGAADTRAASEEMKRLMSEWKAAGPAGREDDDRLWRSFNAARDRLSQRSRFEWEQRKAQRVKSLQDALFRKKQFASELQSRTYDAERRLGEMRMRPSVSMRNPRWSEISSKRLQAESNQQQRVNEMKRKLGEVQRQITELDAKFRQSCSNRRRRLAEMT